MQLALMGVLRPDERQQGLEPYANGCGVPALGTACIAPFLGGQRSCSPATKAASQSSVAQWIPPWASLYQHKRPPPEPLSTGGGQEDLGQDREDSTGCKHEFE